MLPSCFSTAANADKNLTPEGRSAESPPAAITQPPNDSADAPLLRLPRPHPPSRSPPPLPAFPPTMARVATLVGALVLGGAVLAGTPAAAPTGGVAAAAAGSPPATPMDLTEAIRDVQVLTLKATCDGTCQADTTARAAAAGCDQVRLFPTIRMASARCTDDSTGGGGRSGRAGGRGGVDLSRLPGVLRAAPDTIVTMTPPARSSGDAAAAAPGGDVPWGLDRINQEALPLDGSTATRCYPSRGAGVTVFVLDTGITAEHAQFGGRASGMVAPGAPYNTSADEDGHGSHVAGTVAGKTTGVAPAATVVGIRCFSADGTARSVDLVSAIEYVAAFKAGGRGAKVVMNLSFGSFRPDTVNAAVERAAEARVITTIAAGNAPISACRVHPASVEEAITVAASTRADRLASFSARGDCVDVAAPGVNILSVDAFSTDGLIVLSGTSMAAPHAAGLAALILAEDREGADLDNEEVLEQMTRDAPTIGGYPLAWANPSCE